MVYTSLIFPLHLPPHIGPYILGKQVCRYASFMVWLHEFFNFQASNKSNEKRIPWMPTRPMTFVIPKILPIVSCGICARTLGVVSMFGILRFLEVFEKQKFGESKIRYKNRPLFGDETTSGTTYISTVGFKGWEGNMGTPEPPRKSVLCCQGSEKPPLWNGLDANDTETTISKKNGCFWFEGWTISWYRWYRCPSEIQEKQLMWKTISHVWSASISWYIPTPVTSEQKTLWQIFCAIMALQPSPINIAEMKALMRNSVLTRPTGSFVVCWSYQNWHLRKSHGPSKTTWRYRRRSRCEYVCWCWGACGLKLRKRKLLTTHYKTCAHELAEPKQHQIRM